MHPFTIVQASAGSGKTKTLVDRYIDLLRDGNPFQSILCLTFTNAAAEEMLLRISSLLPDDLLRKMYSSTYRIQTIHSFCHELIKNYWDKVDLAPSPILLEDPYSLLNRAYEEFLHNPPIKLRDIDMSYERFSVLLKDLFERRIQMSGQESHLFFKLASGIFNQYENLKKCLNSLDFHDLIHYGVLLLQKIKLDPPVHHVLVDEAQDTSEEQWRILFSLMKIAKSFFIVGDIKQSIYSFQGAKPEIFESLPLKWKDATVMTLNQSYRSVQPILDAVNATFKDSNLSYFSNLNQFSARQSIKGKIVLLPLTTFLKEKAKEKEPFEEKDVTAPLKKTTEHAKNILSFVLDLLISKTILETTNKPIEPKDIMILVQKRSDMIFDLINMFKEHDIACFGPLKTPLTQSLIIQDLMAMGTFSVDPFDDYNLACLLKSPFIGINEDELFDLCFDRKDSLFKVLETKNHQSIGWLNQLQTDVPGPFYQRLWDRFKTNIDRYYEGDIIPFVDAFLDCAWAYTKDYSIRNFHIDLLKSPPLIASSKKEGLRILTVHGSKGLQSPVVILADATTSPSLRQEYFFLDDNGMFNIKFESEHLKQKALTQMYEEYTRLLYVAMTRAQEYLYVMGIESKDKHSWYHQIKVG